jgi:hypothetical protein
MQYVTLHHRFRRAEFHQVKCGRSAFWPMSCVRGCIAFLVAAVGLFAAAPVLSRLEVIGSGRGLALTLGADAAFGITLSEKRSDKSAISILAVQCSNVIYGLDDYKFTEFPQGAPLKQIVAQENKESGNVELLIKVLVPIDKNIRFKQKDNRWVILLTSAKINDFAWSAQGEAKKTSLGKDTESRTAMPASPRLSPSTASPFLKDITVIHRERVEKIVFSFDASTEMIIKSMPDKITALFVNAKNGLSHGAFHPEKDGLGISIELKEVVHGDAKWLGASIYVNRDEGMKPLVQTFPDKLVIYSVRDTKRSFSLWSAKSGTTQSYTFMALSEFPVDLKKIEEKAVSDSKIDVVKAGTFSVQETLPQAAQSTEAATPPVPHITRVVMIKDIVALHSHPSTAAADAVIGHLPLGALASQLEKKGRWIRVEKDTLRGWIMGSLAMDSAKAPKTLWDRIEGVKIAAAKQEAKLREAEKIQQEKKNRQEQLALSKQKALEEEKRKKDEQAAAKLATNEKIASAAPAPHPAPIEKVVSAVIQPAPMGKAAAAVQPAPLEKITSAASLLPTGAGAQTRLGEQLSIPVTMQGAAPAVADKSGPSLIEYKVFGRDPFLPLEQQDEGPLPVVENLQMVGILYDNTARIALFEDVHEKANAYALRENDPIKNGYLLRIKPDEAIFLLNEFGVSRTYVMKLLKEKKSEMFQHEAHPRFSERPDKSVKNETPAETNGN